MRPSSLNYKISLSEAVGAFIKKDTPLQENEFIHVVPEEPKSQPSNSSNKNAGSHALQPGDAYDEFDDLMFDMTTTQVRQQGNTKNKNNPQSPI